MKRVLHNIAHALMKNKTEKYWNAYGVMFPMDALPTMIQIQIQIDIV